MLAPTASATQAICGDPVTRKATRDAGPGPAPLVIGDSVTLGAVDELAAAGFDVDARGCRPMNEARTVVESYRAYGQLPPVVVVFVGANFFITLDDVGRVVRALGPRGVLGLVTPRETGGGISEDVATVRAAGRRWPRRVRVLDWVAYTDVHPEVFGPDRLHLGPGGAEALTRVLSPALHWLSLRVRWSADPVAAAVSGLSR